MIESNYCLLRKLGPIFDPYPTLLNFSLIRFSDPDQNKFFDFQSISKEQEETRRRRREFIDLLIYVIFVTTVLLYSCIFKSQKADVTELGDCFGNWMNRDRLCPT